MRFGGRGTRERGGSSARRCHERLAETLLAKPLRTLRFLLIRGAAGVDFAETALVPDHRDGCWPKAGNFARANLAWHSVQDSSKREN